MIFANSLPYRCSSRQSENLPSFPPGMQEEDEDKRTLHITDINRQQYLDLKDSTEGVRVVVRFQGLLGWQSPERRPKLSRHQDLGLLPQRATLENPKCGARSLSAVTACFERQKTCAISANSSLPYRRSLRQPKRPSSPSLAIKKNTKKARKP